MGTSLSGTKIKDTYDGLIKTSNNAAVGASNIELTDGLGNDINISINNTGDITADGDVIGGTIQKSGGTSTQILLANGTVVTLTLEASGISSNDSDSNVPTNAAVKDYVDTEVSNLVDSAPSTLDTLNELAAALGDDANFSTTVTTALGNRLRIDVNNQGLTSTEKTNALTNLGVTSTPDELNILDGVTATTAEINTLDGVTSTAAELNILDGATLSTAELNFVDGVTSAIQTQIDAKQNTLTAGTGIDITSDTISADLTGLVDTGAIQSDAVTAPKIAQFDDNLSAATAGAIMVSDGTDFTDVVMSGDVTISSSGATTIGASAVESSMINDGAVTNAKLGADAVDGTKIADDAVDSEHYTDASIDEVHLNATNTPTDGYVLTYDNTSGGFTWEEKFDGDITGIVAGNGLTGDAASGEASLAVGAGTGITVNANDVQISDAGVGTTQLADDAVTLAKIADAVIVTETEGISSNDNDTTLPTSAAVKDYVDNNASVRTVTAGGNTLADSETLAFTAGTGISITETGGAVTINSTVTDTTYTAGTGLDLNTQTNVFSLETDLRDSITHIGLDTGDYVEFTNNTQIDFYVNGGNEMRLESDGDLHVDGDVIAFSTTVSDERLKDNVQTIENALEKVEALRGVSYTWKDGKRKGENEIGVIAQEVEKVLPEVVKEKEMALLDGKVYKTVDYEKIIGVLIESVKELSQKVKELEAK